ncbi:hypothetical protein [Budvicia aquatica]|uniref:Uncharacterized protein n=1 Tax=Budvicia aquatica TaxID=82979 RepID=A0A484ZUT8_9GAMM|nr:hypothetical protein [Budvicia aquatica]VFS49209.1 Uncharacterised protein [Budvicia aquatica]
MIRPGIQLLVEALFFNPPMKSKVPDTGIRGEVLAGLAEPGEGGLKQGVGNNSDMQLEGLMVDGWLFCDLTHH